MSIGTGSSLPTYPERNEARSKPKVSSFISARYEKIEALQPDLVLQMIRVLAGIVGCEDKGRALAATLEEGLDRIRTTACG